jgi:NhaP-type Na+/H+ or K+/H+ antiporter
MIPLSLLLLLYLWGAFGVILLLNVFKNVQVWPVWLLLLVLALAGPVGWLAILWITVYGAYKTWKDE